MNDRTCSSHSHITSSQTVISVSLIWCYPYLSYPAFVSMYLYLTENVNVIIYVSVVGKKLKMSSNITTTKNYYDEGGCMHDTCHDIRPAWYSQIPWPLPVACQFLPTLSCSTRIYAAPLSTRQITSCYPGIHKTCVFCIITYMQLEKAKVLDNILLTSI